MCINGALPDGRAIAPEISDTLYPLPKKERRRNICSGLRRVGGGDRVSFSFS